MRYNTEQIGELVRKTRKAQGLRQRDLAMMCRTGVRFIGELEKGKPGCEFAKVLHVIQMLGITVQLTPPPIDC